MLNNAEACRGFQHVTLSRLNIMATTKNYCCHIVGGAAAAVPPPFRPSEPALCGSCHLVTTYYCRLGDLLCLFV